MTSETIAYVATQVCSLLWSDLNLLLKPWQAYFTLNSDGEFDSVGSNSSFSYSTYGKIIKSLTGMGKCNKIVVWIRRRHFWHEVTTPTYSQ